jgi:hypothetical protein
MRAGSLHFNPMNDLGYPVSAVVGGPVITVPMGAYPVGTPVELSPPCLPSLGSLLKRIGHLNESRLTPFQPHESKTHRDATEPVNKD